MTPASFHDEAGLTLIELLVVMLIMGGIIGSLTTVFVSGMRAEAQMNERFQAQNQARLALDKVRRDIHCSTQVADGWTASSVTLVNSCTPSGAVSWCTQPSANGFALHRVDGAGPCSVSGARYANDLLTGSVFAYQAPSDESLAKLRVDLPVLLPTMTNPYRLCDVIVLRNSVKSIEPLDPVPACP